jgi:hypothetical protein
MELLTCPSCGCSVQVSDVLLGRRVRCFTCRHSFIAEVKPAVPRPSRRDALPLPQPAGPPQRDNEDTIHDQNGPFCPECGRRISWTDAVCPYCGEELEPEDGPPPAWRRNADLIRRDCEPHRGPLIVSLGNFSMIFGVLSLCTFGLGAVLSLPLGIFALLMATRDLERMRDGRMDTSGKSQTQIGRTIAAIGVCFSLIFVAFYALVWLAR